MKYTYFIRRFLSAIPVLLIITFATFALMQALPGGPLSAYENNPEIKAEDIARLRHELGLDRPVHIQYIRWLQNFLKGDWGYSYATKRPVLREIWERLPNTIYLTALALIVALLIAVPVGIVSATRQYSVFDHIVTTLTYIGRSMPIYYSGLLLIIFFSIWLRWLPSGGMYTLGKEFSILDRVKHLLLPLLSLSTLIAAQYARYLRTSMLEVLHQDYIRTAAAKGLHQQIIIYKHAFRNAAIPLVTIVAIDLPILFAGALFTETIYSWPGMGRLFVDSSLRFDYPIVMGIVTTIAFLVVICNLLADMVYAILDPRITYS
ncbi:binding-protein-dependent transport systems inner membrane component [Candidatus Vecturithrix granuli]|uniref:Binding-protein-dependent transport systems inner membrane component n=1 Tax=Vecturithrix granuli TaxID=1499967 RepID=A0A081BWN8_VECG1|nr:binding-protein-dependent transport systems inner membrane component [Candidatus Vecturithrix granuli]